MELLLHGLWSYIVWKDHQALLAVVFGILPDVLALGPIVAQNALRGRVDMHELLREDDLSPALKRYKALVFPLTHSLVVALAASTAVFLVWGAQWWVLAWPLHVLFDVFTHRNDDATPFLYPFSSYTFHGVHWTNTRFRIANYALMGVVYSVVLVF